MTEWTIPMKVEMLPIPDNGLYPDTIKLNIDLPSISPMLTEKISDSDIARFKSRWDKINRNALWGRMRPPPIPVKYDMRLMEVLTGDPYPWRIRMGADDYDMTVTSLIYRKEYIIDKMEPWLRDNCSEYKISYDDSTIWFSDESDADMFLLRFK